MQSVTTTNMRNAMAFVRRRAALYVVVIAVVAAVTGYFGRRRLAVDIFEYESDRSSDDVLTDTGRRTSQLRDIFSQTKYAEMFVAAQLGYLSEGEHADDPVYRAARDSLAILGKKIANSSPTLREADAGPAQPGLDAAAKAGLLAYVRDTMVSNAENRPISNAQGGANFYLTPAESNRWDIDIRCDDPRIVQPLQNAIAAALNKTVGAYSEDEVTRRRNLSAAHVEEARLYLESVQARQFEQLKALEEERADLKIDLYRLDEDIRQIEAREKIVRARGSNDDGSLADPAKMLSATAVQGGLDEQLFNSLSRRLAVIMNRLKKPDESLQALVTKFKSLSATHIAVKARIDLSTKALVAASNAYTTSVASASTTPDRALFALAKIDVKDGLLYHTQPVGSPSEFSRLVFLVLMSLVMGVLAATALAFLIAKPSDAEPVVNPGGLARPSRR